MNKTKIQLLSLGRVRPSTYNPRSADPKRLQLVEMSLRKLGFLIPIYASPAGEILSGHQRHLVAERMGVKRVPVVFTRAMTIEERKAINIAFNRGTNDMESWDQPKPMTKELMREKLEDLACFLPDRVIDTPEFYPCMQQSAVPVRRLLEANEGRWKQYAANLAVSLRRRGIVMPIVVGPDFRVINGIGRLQMLAEKKERSALVVMIDQEQADFAAAMLNLLSMDFDIHTRYADLLRHNSFRRARRVRNELGRGFVFAVHGGKTACSFDINRPGDRRRWIQQHGTNVLDFGAGHLTETFLLRSVGIDCTPFEPYRIGDGEQIDKAESVRLANMFLDQVEAGKEWDSIFISSVLNSVPFYEDRQAIITICAALCDLYSDSSKVYAVASSTLQTAWLSTMGAQFLNEKDVASISFPLDYEPGIKLGEISKTPKVQKYHTVKEFTELFGEFFQRVKVHLARTNVEAIAWDPKPVRPAKLRRALELEFNLPYPDGSRMDLVDRAISAFSKRLGVKL